MKLSIVTPVYHEEKNILKVISEIETKVKTPYELLIVFDDKKDPTYPVVNEYIKSNPGSSVKLVQNSFGDGKGAMNAIKTGFKEAKGDAVVVVMGDLSDDISNIDKMARLIDQGYDIVCGSRYMKGGKQIGGPLIKSLMSRTAGLSLHYLFKIPTKDSTNAFKMYRKKVLDSIAIESTGGFEYSLELVLKAYKLGFKITEIPTTWTDRAAGKSNFKLLKWLPKYAKWYFSAIKKNNPK